MITHETVRQLALALPKAQEHDHWGRPSFRVRKKIFATTWPEEQRAVLKLTPTEQQHLVATDPVTFSPIPGAWGQKGWTFVQFDNLEQESFQQVLLAAWRQVAPTRLVVAYGQPG